MAAPAIPEWTQLLARVPLFGCLPPEELQTLATLFVEIAYYRGDTVCTEGEEGNTFFICLSGKLEVWGGAGQRQVINRLGPGDHFSELSLLLGGKRAVTVLRNTGLLALNKAAFDRFFAHNPKVLEYFSRVLSQQLATMARGEYRAAVTTVIGVAAAPGLKRKTLVATALAALLRERGARAGREVRSAAAKQPRVPWPGQPDRGVPRVQRGLHLPDHDHHHDDDSDHDDQHHQPHGVLPERPLCNGNCGTSGGTCMDVGGSCACTENHCGGGSFPTCDGSCPPRVGLHQHRAVLRLRPEQLRRLVAGSARVLGPARCTAV